MHGITSVCVTVKEFMHEIYDKLCATERLHANTVCVIGKMPAQGNSVCVFARACAQGSITS